jgi:aryl-alcohol dehydrogenase-like predicted oxidoreductase
MDKEHKKMTRREFVRDSAMAAAGIAAGFVGGRSAFGDEAGKKILNYNENMEYRKLGKTGLLVSAVCLGGHWKRIDVMKQDFDLNRRDVVTRCMERGINHIDACTIEEVQAYSKALKGRRDKMYLACSWYQNEMRNEDFRTKKALLGTLDEGMKEAGLDYVDLWRITMHEQSGRHTEAEVEQMMEALEAAKKQGKVRFTGFSSHDRPHIKWMIETYPNIVDAICTPYTAKSKVLPQESLFDAVKQHNVGVFGIKPFASNSLFRGSSAPDSPDAEEDDRRARLAIRYILCNPAITAPIPGLISEHQVDNVAKAVTERRQLDLAETAELEKAADEMWARLPEDYQWLKDWEYV